MKSSAVMYRQVDSFDGQTITVDGKPCYELGGFLGGGAAAVVYEVGGHAGRNYHFVWCYTLLHILVPCQRGKTKRLLTSMIKPVLRRRA